MKQKQYWLRGGIIGFIAGTILIVVAMLTALNYDCSTKCTPYWYDVIGYISGWLSFPLTSVAKRLIGPGAYILNFVFIPATYFMYGVIIGWLYGKIKNRQYGATTN